VRLKPAPQVAWQVVDGEAVVVDLASGVTIGLNPAGTFIWSQLAGHDENDIAAATATHFDIDAQTAAADVDEFLRMLRARNLIVEESAA